MGTKRVGKKPSRLLFFPNMLRLMAHLGASLLAGAPPSKWVACVVPVALAAACVARAGDVPPVAVSRLPNGLTVMLVEDRSVPLAHVEYRGRAGSLLDPAGKEGLALLTASMLTYGTRSRTEAELNEAAAGLGAELVAEAGMETFSAGGSVPTIEAEALDSYLELLADVLLLPSFPEEGFERARQRLAGQVGGLADQRGVLADRAMSMFLFRGHPYGRPTSGTLESLARIEREDVERFHRTRVLPDDAVLALAGDFDSRAVLRTLGRRLGGRSWGDVCEGARCVRRCVRTGRASSSVCTAYRDGAGTGPASNPLLELMPPARPKGLRILLVDTGDPTLSQAQIRLGAPLARRYGDDGWHAHLLASEVLGGDFTARLNERLRVKEGLTYGARWVSQYDDRLSGAAFLTTYTDPKSLVRLVRIAREEVRRLVREPIPGDELERVSQRLVRSFVFRFETASAVLSEHLGLWQEGLPQSHLTTFCEKLASTGAEHVAPILGDFPDEDVAVVVVGNRALSDDLGRYAKEAGGSLETVGLDWLGL